MLRFRYMSPPVIVGYYFIIFLKQLNFLPRREADFLGGAVLGLHG